MGMIYADVELINGAELEMVRRKYIDEEEIKRLKCHMLVDTGCCLLAINEHIQEILQLPVMETKQVQLADGRIIECDVVAPVELRFHNRRSSCSAIVLPGDTEPLLGVIPMEELDVVIHPQKKKLIPHPGHPYIAQTKSKSSRSARDAYAGRAEISLFTPIL